MERKCRVTGVVDDEGKPVNVPTIWWVQELEDRIRKLEQKPIIIKE